MRRWIRRLAVLAVLALIVIVLRFTVFRPEPVPVTVVTLDRGRVEDTVVNSRAGTVESRRRSSMSPGIAGLVEAIGVEKGERVKKGQMLLRLDDSEHRARVAVARSAVDAASSVHREACANLEQAERDLARAEGMAESGLLSEERLEQARTAAETAQAACNGAENRVSEARAGLDAAKAALAKTVMVAPFDGVVLDVTTEVGEWISPSPPGIALPPVIDLIDPDDLYVSAPLDEADLARIRPGLPVRITLDALRGREFEGALTYVSSFVETEREQNRTLTVEATFTAEELPPTLLPGISADVEVILDARDDVLRVPTYALLEGSRVLRVNGETLEAVTVETGLRNWSWTEVTGGLAPGDRVVTSLDRAEVKAGARVEVRPGSGE